MNELTIVTNHQPRDVIYGHELTEAERAEFGYINWTAVEAGEDSAEFFRYKGNLYDLSDNEPVGGCAMPDGLKGWDGYYSDSYFSGVVFRFPREQFGRYGEELDTEHVIVGRYYS